MTTSKKNTFELVEVIWEKAKDTYDIHSSWDTLEYIVVQGLETWDDESLINEANDLGIDVIEYIDDNEDV